MKRVITPVFVCIVLFIGLKTALHAQPFNYTMPFDLELKPCPFNPSIFVLQPKDWVIYQTTNSAWDGPIDSTRCIIGEPIGSEQMQVDLSQINPDQALFVRWQGDSSAFPISTNWVAQLSSGIQLLSSNIQKLQLGTDCVQDLCTGSIVRVRIPDENGQYGTAFREHFGVAQNYNPYLFSSACIVTEKFNVQTLSDVIIKISFTPGADLQGEIIQFDYAYFEEPNGVPTFDHIYVDESNKTAPNTYTISTEELMGFEFYTTPLGLYTAPTYPSESALSYIPIRPEPNTSEQAQITILADFYGLQLQPYTILRGDTVVGSDSIRHHFTLVGAGEFCFGGFIDFIFNGDDAFRSVNSSIYMGHPQACMQFKPQSRLEVAANTSLRYSQDGAGLLALCNESLVQVEAGATLEVNAQLLLVNCDTQHPSNAVVDLHPGATLRFGEEARLVQHGNQERYLTVRMLGGTLDEAELRPEDRALIVLEYPSPDPVWSSNLTVFPNPADEQTTLQYIASKEGENLQLRWMDLNGRLLHTSTVQTSTKGFNAWALPIPVEENGMFLLSISDDKHTAVVKVVRAE